MVINTKAASEPPKTTEAWSVRSLDKNMKNESIFDMFHQPETSTLRARESIASTKAKRFYNIKTDVIHATYINIDRFDKIMILRLVCCYCIICNR